MTKASDNSRSISIADHEHVSYEGATIIEDILKCLPNIEDICTCEEKDAILTEIRPKGSALFQPIYYKVPAQSNRTYCVDKIGHPDVIVGIYAKTDCTYTCEAWHGTCTYTLKKGEFSPMLNGKMPYPVVITMYTWPEISIIEGDVDIVSCYLNISTRRMLVSTAPLFMKKQLWNICDNLYIQSGLLGCL